MAKELPTRHRFRVIQVRMWGDKKFRALSPILPSGQALWFYLLTGPHTGPIPGIFSRGRASLAEELGWSMEAFDKAFQEVFDQDMAKADWKARVVWLPNAIESNRPASPNVVKSWGKEWDLIPECPLKSEALESMRAFVGGLGKAFAEAFEKAFGKEFDKAFDESSRKTMAIQEQEQEQELTNSRRQLTGAVDNFSSVDNSGLQNDETTTEGEQHAHLTPETDENGSGADGDEPPPSEAWQEGASGGAGGSREPATYSRTSEMAISIAWLREQGVTIEADSELIAEWAARGVTQGLVEKALAKARTYKLNRIPEKYLATIVAEKLAEKAKPARMSVGQDEASVKAAARALGMGEGNPGESLPELRRRVLQRMSETEHAS
ncbi:hypothetical protein [Burkholderia gladioli]|uniref:hypothetical protein n=1 Tax=Burkholderia gladioli TaxID=28095 RepID=UPI0016401FCE|nr:hypothetical protein [Burkholderia gladioli]